MGNVTLFAPAGRTGQVQTSEGNYDVVNGKVTVDDSLVSALLDSGFTFLSAAGKVNLLDAFCQDGAPLAAAAAAGDFGVSLTPGTSFYLVGESTQNTTKTDKALWEITLPDSYVAGNDVVVTPNAGFSGTGTVSTKTVDVNAYEQAADGTQGADLCGTAAQNLGAVGVYSDFAFVIDGDNLAPGDKLLIVVTLVLTETGNMNPVLPRLNSVSIA